MPTDASLTPGALLVAAPTLGDPNFRRTIVLLCAHDPDASGSFGLVLNQPLQDVHLGEVLDDAPRADFPLALGGPVQPDTLHLLHRHGETVPGAAPVADGVHWGGDFETVRTLLQHGTASPADLRLFLGYAGWTPAQLEAEIEEGGWIVTDARAEEIFSTAPDALWRSVLRRMGGEYALLANFPDNPRMN